MNRDAGCIATLALIAGVMVAASSMSAGCGGGGWSSSDVSTATDAVHAQLAIERLCAADAGSCNAAQVRALERMALCADSSRLAAHGAPVPDSGIACQAP